MTVMVFDIETIPDWELGATWLGLNTPLPPEQIVLAMQAKRRTQTAGQDFLPLFLHRVVAISVVMAESNRVRVWSLGEVDSDEAELITRFFQGLERFMPTLVSWNGSGFDLPVLHYRALKHGIAAAQYWEQGERHGDFKWNNYLNRFHSRHLDLMDVLANYQSRAFTGLDDVASLIGLPGKQGQGGNLVWSQYQAGDINGIRDYCETDVLNTYLVYLRFELIRGRLSVVAYDKLCAELASMLESSAKPHLEQFLQQWHRNRELKS